MAQDVGISASDLRALATHCTGAADLLDRRLEALGVNGEELAHTAPSELRDMQRLCTMCESKGRCARDLAADPSDPVWRQYCPNHETLMELARTAIARWTVCSFSSRPDRRRSEPMHNVFAEIAAISPIPIKLIGAENGRQCMEILNEGRINVAFIDVNMPEMSGMDAVVEARRRHQDFVVLLSTTENKVRLQLARQLRVYEFLAKPFTADGAGKSANLLPRHAPSKALIVDDSATVRRIICRCSMTASSISTRPKRPTGKRPSPTLKTTVRRRFSRLQYAGAERPRNP